MWGRNRRTESAAEEREPRRLKDAIREARIESAERSGVVVDLRDAEVARLELLNEALDPVFAEVPAGVELFDRGISRGDTPRLWIDIVAYVVMGRDKRLYRFVQDTRYGRKVVAESFEAEEIVAAVTRYVARRLVEREQALTDNSLILSEQNRREARSLRSGRVRRALGMFVLGVMIGIAALFAAAWVLGPPA